MTITLKFKTRKNPEEFFMVYGTLIVYNNYILKFLLMQKKCLPDHKPEKLLIISDLYLSWFVVLAIYKFMSLYSSEICLNFILRVTQLLVNQWFL